MQQIKQTKDSNPSRFSYRIQRLWLRPNVRKACLFVMPALVVMAVGVKFVTTGELNKRWDATYNAIKEKVADRPEYMLKEIQITGVSTHLKAELHEVLGIALPTSSFRVDLSEVKERAEALSAVKTANIYLKPDGILLLEAEERSPVMMWRSEKGLQLVDEEGVVLGAVENRTDRGELPLIAGVGATENITEAIELVQIAEPIHERMRGFVRQGERRWTLVLDRNLEVLLPEKNPSDALRTLLAVHDAKDLLNRDISKVDLRDPKRPVLRLTNGAIQALDRLQNIKKGEDV